MSDYGLNTTASKFKRAVDNRETAELEAEREAFIKPIIDAINSHKEIAVVEENGALEAWARRELLTYGFTIERLNRNSEDGKVVLAISTTN